MVNILEPILESFFSKVGEKLGEYAYNTMTSIKDFEFTLKTLERNLKSSSAKASDIEEEIKKAELSGKKKRKGEIGNWLIEAKSIETEFRELEKEVESEGFINRFMDGGRAAQLNERVGGLVEQSRLFGELLLDVYQGEALLTSRLVGKAFEENLERIWRLLLNKEVSSIGIHGMGGAGKTTLAKHINNRLIEKSQECFWVTVSQAFNIRTLQDKIGHVIGLDISEEDDEDKRAARLNQALSLKENVVLIFDDVWENISIEKVGDPLRVEGCRLIITTRSLEVCRQIGCQEVISVAALHEDEAWNLFNDTLGKETKLALQVEEIAKSMSKLCSGLPLGIKTLAGRMRGETSMYSWRNVLEELKESVMGRDDMRDQVFKVLKYSFDRLDKDHKRRGQISINGYSSLQLSFLHCSLYPKDYKIPKEELVRKFIVEELMDERKSRKAQVDQGQSILDKLVKVCLLESTVDDDGRDCVKMHDLVRAMALKINEGKTMVGAGISLDKVPEQESWTKDLEKVSLMLNRMKEIPLGMSPNCPKLSTLLFRDNPLGVVPDSFFSQMHGLCTLDLSKTEIKRLPNSLFELEGLKALRLGECTELEYVPYLGKLKALMELDLSGSAIREVPQGIDELLNLKFLSIDAPYLKMFPTGLLPKLPNLQYLKFPFHIELPIEEIERLRRVEEFWGRVQNVTDFNRFIRSGQGRAHQTFYNIQLGLSREEDFRGYNQVMVYCKLGRGVENDEAMMGEDIQHLIISHCLDLSNCLLDDFSSNPRSLNSLRIFDCEGIECILTSEQLVSVKGTESQFSSLEEIVLEELRDFKGVITLVEASPSPPTPARQAAFPSLRWLYVSRCHKMRSLWLPTSEFPNLEHIKVSDCEEIEEIMQVAVSLPKLKYLQLHRLPRLKSICNATMRNLGLPTSEFPNLEHIRVSDCEEIEEIMQVAVSLPKLKYLQLHRLPRLKSICNSTMICASIEKIDVHECPTLKKLPLHVAPPPAPLEEIRMIKAEWESLEWYDPTDCLYLRPFLRF